MNPTKSSATTRQPTMDTDASTRSIAEHAAIFAAAGPEVRALIGQAAERVSLDDGAFLFRQGDPSDALYVVIDGRLEVVRDPAHENAPPVVLGPGDVVGELQVFVGGQRTADVRSTLPTTLVRVSRNIVLRALELQPGVFDGVLELIQTRLRRNELRAALPRLFGHMDEPSRLEIEDRLEWQRYDRGETIFRLGDEGDGMYFVLSGRLRAFLPNDDGPETILGDVGRGEFVGEMATLTRERRSASVRALRDSQLVRLSYEAVHQVADRHPRLLMQVSKILIHRQRRQYTKAAGRAAVSTIAVIGLNEGVPVEAVAQRLARELHRLGPTRLVDPRSAEEALGLVGVTGVAGGDAHRSRVTTWLAEQEARHAHVVLLAGHRPTAWAETCVRQADKVLLVARADDDPAPGETETALFGEKGGAGVPAGLVLLHPDDTTLPSGTARWLEPRSLERHYHLCLGRDADVPRLARLVTGKALGVALGGGGARGGAHIGVLRALRGAGITIDAIGGTSAGAGVGALYAMGLDDEAILAVCIDGFVKHNPFRALTLPVMSLVSRRRMDQQARRMFGDVQIEDLWTDYFCVACNLTTGTTEMLRKGPLWKAVRATTSLPGVAVPVVHNGDLLIDGGVMDNLPGRFMRTLVGGTVVVVDISQGERMASSYAYEDIPGPWQIVWSQVNPFRPSIRMPSIPRVIMRAVTVSSQGERASALADADLALQPPVSGYGAFDFSAIEQMADDAEAYTIERLRTARIGGAGKQRSDGLPTEDDA